MLDLYKRKFEKCFSRDFEMKFILIATLLLLTITSQFQASDNPPDDNIQSTDSDTTGIKIADQVMNALGGNDNWDNTRYICWNFFGRRFHIWDKWSGNLHLEDGDLIVLMNLNTVKGRVWQNGEEITYADSLRKKLQNAYAKWINDSYWMFMPYKLRDPGVNLRYKGEGVTLEGDSADILQLTFENVGLTPNNKYRVYVGKKSNLVIQFDYFKNASDDKPTIQAPWKDWKRYGNILLSDDRGKNRKMTDIAVFDRLPESVFTDPQPIDLQQLMTKQEDH
jgi:hypothetical protein